ncbi:hypothetical protein ACL6C3_25990 [Capilliphycus salinus ALCB114379]
MTYHRIRTSNLTGTGLQSHRSVSSCASLPNQLFEFTSAFYR